VVTVQSRDIQKKGLLTMGVAYDILPESGGLISPERGGILVSMRPVEVEAAVDEVLRQAVLVLIDHALDKNDKALFLLLTWELRKLNEKWPGLEGLEALSK
jgi:hypothetical protein